MGFKFMLGIQILIRLDPDLFGPILVLERTLEVCGPIFHPRSQIRISVVAKTPDLWSRF
jgi:hypothetical protein